MELKELKGHTESANSVAFSSDCTWIVSGSDDNSVRVWDAFTGVELKELRGHTGKVNSVAFSNDGTWIVFVLRFFLFCFVYLCLFIIFRCESWRCRFDSLLFDSYHCHTIDS